MEDVPTRLFEAVAGGEDEGLEGGLDSLQVAVKEVLQEGGRSLDGLVVVGRASIESYSSSLAAHAERSRADLLQWEEGENRGCWL